MDTDPEMNFHQVIPNGMFVIEPDGAVAIIIISSF